MIEKVNPSHPDKIADRIAGAIVDLAYKTEVAPKIAVEVLIGHGKCHVIIETTAAINPTDVEDAIHRIDGAVWADIDIVPQDKHLSDNQSDGIRCGDNGIFKGMPLTEEQKALSVIAHDIYTHYPYDGKYIIDEARLIICQSNASTAELSNMYPPAEIRSVIGLEEQTSIPALLTESLEVIWPTLLLVVAFTGKTYQKQMSHLISTHS